MLIDHVGMVFFSEYFAFRIVGRLAFILYAFMLVEGIFHTKNRKKYLCKLFLWATISEMPYDLLCHSQFFHWENQNVLWLFLGSASGIIISERYNNKTSLLLGILPVLLKVDYDWYGALVVYTFYFARKFRREWILAILGLNTLAEFYLYQGQIYAFLGLIPILFYNGSQGRKTGNLYYSFYAIQYIMLFIIKYMGFKMGYWTI